jgi:hypothetical protein
VLELSRIPIPIHRLPYARRELPEPERGKNIGEERLTREKEPPPTEDL